MPNYRRNYVPGGTFFFTLVTYDRRSILTTDLGRRCLREAMETVREVAPLDLLCICLLPEHLHTVWVLPPNSADFSVRWNRLKRESSTRWLAAGGTEADVTPAI